ncbi:hypothetical protein [Vandammella animalimorsus]|nr:hypothetical protein [Vandammella animalimorsus]
MSPIQPMTAGKRIRGQLNREGLTVELAHVWRHLRDAGGWWSAQELQTHWYPLFEDLRQFEAGLRRLLHIGSIERRISIEQAGLPVYGVTRRCTPLPGYTLEPGEGPC